MTLSNDKLGEIAAVIGKARETVPAEMLPDYDAKRAAMAAERERQAAEMAEYNRLAALGHSDKEIERIMRPGTANA